MILVNVPGAYWEIEFLEDGGVDVERFRSDGTISGQEAIEELFTDFGEVSG